ncbi:hypothetical protein [Streptomyces sp. NPDC002994]|uniref:hypothetical protein n=1 Tax=Streptomyces sp. NPDC002994 TaxID=3154441 RepID=UPI0033A01277
MDLESITDELYGLAPADFTAARNERAAAARAAGDRELAARIQALRRPTLSAWAGNLLVRRQPEQVQPLLSLGEGMRRAHRDLDGEQLRELGRRQHDLVGALGRQAKQLAADAGHPVSEDVQHEVERTLHAVLADPEAAQEWAAGRLTKPLSPPVGFTAATTPDAVPRKAPPDTSAAEEKAKKKSEARRAKLAQAEQDAKAAEQKALARDEELAQAGARLEEAEGEVAALAEQLKEAKERQKAAREDVVRARDRAREAGTAARKARRRAEDASVNADGR